MAGAAFVYVVEGSEDGLLDVFSSATRALVRALAYVQDGTHKIGFSVVRESKVVPLTREEARRELLYGDGIVFADRRDGDVISAIVHCRQVK